MPFGEEELIARFFAPLAGAAGLGLHDDAALMAVPPGESLVLTQDALVAGVHFFADDPPDTIARKALGVNLSDLAAKGARPAGYLLAIALPDGWTPAFLEGFVAGLTASAAAADCPLVGGDTVRTSGPLTLSITALGLVSAARGLVPRTGARAGDRLYVTGTVGDAALGLLVRQAERGGTAPPWVKALDPASRAALRDRYLVPQPRLALRAALAHANAAMDISDGFVGDAAKMLRVSGVSGRIAAPRVPLSGAAAAALRIDATLRTLTLTGGDDYEVLASVAPDQAAAFEAAASAAGLVVTAVGEVVTGAAPLVVTDANGVLMAFATPSYSHT